MNTAIEESARRRARTCGALGNGARILSLVVLPHESMREAVCRLGAQLGIREGFLDMTTREVEALARVR